MEDPPVNHLMSPILKKHYPCSNASPGYFPLYCKFRSLFQLPRIHAAELPLQQNKPVSPADALTAAAESLQKKVVQNKSLISEVEIQQFLSSETGLDRLKRMYTKDVDGFQSPELWFIGQSLMKICGMTFLITSYIGGKHGGDKFIKENQATSFRTQFQASRLRNDHVVLAGMKSGFIWTYRVGIFSSIFLFLSQSIAVYRNKSSVIEYVIASGVTGSLLKANLGPKGMVSGGVFGSLMGCSAFRYLPAFSINRMDDSDYSTVLLLHELMGGTLIYGFMLMTNETQEQRHYWNIQKYLEIQRELNKE